MVKKSYHLSDSSSGRKVILPLNCNEGNFEVSCPFFFLLFTFLLSQRNLGIGLLFN